MATYTDPGHSPTSSKTGSTSIATAFSFTPGSTGGWVVIAVASDPSIPANPTMSSSADTANPVRFIGQSVRGSGTNGVAISVFMHQVASNVARTYTASFGSTSVVAKVIKVVGHITGTDVPQDSATIADFCDKDTFGSSASGAPSAGFVGTPPAAGNGIVAGIAVGAVEAPASTSVSWSITETQSGSQTGNVVSWGTSGSGSASNVSGTHYGSDTSTSSPDMSADFLATATFGVSTDAVLVVVRLLTGSTTRTVSLSGISSGGSIGVPNLVYNQTVSLSGLASAGSVGSVTVGQVQVVAPTGISTAETLGSPTLTTTVTIQPAGLSTPGAVGTPTVVAGSVTVALTGAITGLIMGTPTIFNGPITLQPTGIGTAESIGAVRITTPPLTLVLPGIESAESMGRPTVGALVYLASPPTRQSFEVANGSRLWSYYQETEGVTWYKVGGVWQTGNFLAADLVADELYRGGYEYPVTQAKADELQALGFTIRTEIR